MDKSPITAEEIFAEATEQPPGGERDRWLAGRCGGDAVLHAEVSSLLRAHDEAGNFMKPSPSPPKARPDSTTVLQGTAVMTAALHADAFLRGFSRPDQAQVENFVAQLPAAVRGEARERIQAGLNVRQLRGQERRPGSEPW